MNTINKVAVIGSGVMGSGIAAHIANAGIPVILMDIVPQGETNRNALAEKAIERLLQADPAPLTHKRNAKKITPANLEDHLQMLADVDWIIEVVLERLDVKQALFEKLEAHRKKGSIVSSNTSTLPLHLMAAKMPESFQRDFLITHFFNPPRYMRLLELVVGEKTRKDAVESVRRFCNVNLGKGVVPCKDTPGFIANRIGCFWLTVGVLEAMRLKVGIEDADAVMGRPIGVPKTGVFGLMDLIGIDLMPLIAKSFRETLPASDAFCQVYREPELVSKMIADGYTGRKGKGGFYRLNTEGGKKIKESIDLQTGQYTPSVKSSLESVGAAKGGLRSLVTHSDHGGQYAKSVLVQVLAYTASLIPEISDDIVAVDEAMKLGYNWKYGPFELIDKLAEDGQSGAAWLAAELKAQGKAVPAILEKVGNGTFYKQDDVAVHHFHISKGYTAIAVEHDEWMLADKKRGKKPVIKNASASLWDLGDGVACLEYHTKMNSVDLFTLEMIQKSIDKVKSDFKGLVIGNDGEHFCAGANIGLALFVANVGAWKVIEDLVVKGQEAYMGLKYAPFPVVTAPSGLALGGGCEVLLHSDAVQAHIETYTGLVEVGVGLIPGWGGCKEMLLRHMAHRDEQGGVAALGRAFQWLAPVRWANMMPAVRNSFMAIAMAKVSKSAHEAKEMLILNEKSRITMNRKRLLPDAKALCLELARDYKTPEPQMVRLPGKAGRAALYMGINDFVKSGKATPYDETVSKAVANVLSGGLTDVTREMTEQQLIDLEREEFMKLVRNEGTWNRLEHMLETGKPLRN